MIVDRAWNGDGYLGEIARQVKGSNGAHHLVPLARTEHYHNLELAGNPQFIHLEKLTGETRLWELEERLFEYLCRLLLSSLRTKGTRAQGKTPDGQPAPVQLFLSHAKRGGGDELIRQIRDELDKTPLRTFYDARDITSGSDWKNALYENAGRDVLIALVTDPYATRDWCRREILTAKEAGCPVVIVVALDQGEARNFAYAGNVPTIPWRMNASAEDQAKTIHRLLRVTLRELLRHTHFLRQCETMQEQGFLSEGCVGFGSPPELLTFHFQARARRNKSGGPCLFLYPDPPLSLREGSCSLTSILTSESRRR